MWVIAENVALNYMLRWDGENRISLKTVVQRKKQVKLVKTERNPRDNVFLQWILWRINLVLNQSVFKM